MPCISRTCLSLLWVCAVFGCDSPGLAPIAGSRENTRDVANLPSPSAQYEEQVNPFAATARPPMTPQHGELCVLATVKINTIHVGAPLEGRVEFKNRCGFSVAVLTSPIEVRTAFINGSMLHWEGMGSPYARLYIYQRELGRPKLIGDAGAPVLGAPDYVVIVAKRAASIPLVGDTKHTLSRGRYGVFFQTRAVATTLGGTKNGAIDLGESLAFHNLKNEGKPPLPTAQSFMPVHSRDTYLEIDY